MPGFENKKLILLYGCLVIFFPGAFVFGFPGVMAAFWQESFQVNKEQIGKIMFFMLAGAGSSMYLSGRLIERFKAACIILIGTFVCSLATGLSGLAGNLTQIYIWAFVEGFFIGFIYIPSLTIFQKMFPDNRGLVTGCINLTFGGSAAVMSPVFTYALVSRGYEFTCLLFGAVAAVTGVAAALFIREPKVIEDVYQHPDTPLLLREILTRLSFWRIWGVWALGGAAGISLVVLTASFGEYKGFTITQYVYILTCFNILNGLGRIMSGHLADIYSKQHILVIVFLMAAASYFVMPWCENLYLISFLACFIGLAFGALFTVSAPLVVEVFGLENFGRVLGLVFTAYGFAAGALGPWLSGLILDMTQLNFTLVFTLFACFFLVSAFLIYGVRNPADSR